MSIKTHMYFAFADSAKHPAPLREVIEEAIACCRERNPSARPGMLLLHPVHRVALGETVHADGQTWQTTYNALIHPREVRVGPVDEEDQWTIAGRSLPT